MVFRNEREQGGKTPNDGRVGVDIPRFRGWNGDADPAAVPPDQFAYLENVDIEDAIVARGGQAKAAPAAYPAIEGIFEASDIGAPDDGGMPPFTECLPGPGGAAGMRLFVIKHQDDTHFGVSTYDPANFLVTLPADAAQVSAEGEVVPYHFGIDPDRALVIVGSETSPVAATDRNVYGITQDGVTSVLFALPALGGDTQTQFRTPVKVSTSIYGVQYRHAAGGTGSHIVRWDGAAVTVENANAAETNGAIVCAHAGNLYYVEYGTVGPVTSGQLYRRDGAAVYTHLGSLHDGGSVFGDENFIMFSDGTDLWISASSSNTYSIWKLVAGAPVLQHQFYGGAVAGYPVSFLSIGGSLYYGLCYSNAIPIAVSWIGKYNGATWDDDFIDLADYALEGFGAFELGPLLHGFCKVGANVFLVALDLVLSGGLLGYERFYQANDPTDLTAGWTQVGYVTIPLGDNGTCVFPYSVIGLTGDHHYQFVGL